MCTVLVVVTFMVWRERGGMVVYRRGIVGWVGAGCLTIGCGNMR